MVLELHRMVTTKHKSQLAEFSLHSFHSIPVRTLWVRLARSIRTGNADQVGVLFKVTQQVNEIPNLCLSLFGSLDPFLGQAGRGTQVVVLRGSPTCLPQSHSW